ncbi:hypothetical protein [Microbulbifer epialgicus]|uniref:Uncharacterized protein n=1 Tax=Microbulbifer epialgicus TaxID=393907 RepID=A0ABV4NTL5_9GAMM
MRLLIAEKPYLVKKLKDENLLSPDSDIEIVFTYNYGFWRFAQPKISFRDIPFTCPPGDLKPKFIKPKKLLINADGNTVFSISNKDIREHQSSTIDEMIRYLRVRMPGYKEVICAVDPDRSGFGAARQLLDQICFDSAPPIHCLYLYSMDSRLLISAWNSRKKNIWDRDSKAQKLADIQYAKNTFDYWWNTNSSIVLSEACKWVNLAAAPFISKYELMTIFIVSENPGISEYDLMKTMSSWEGSGKYSFRENSQIGTPASRCPILESANKRGALVIRKGKNSLTSKYSLTSAGASFVNRLHKKTFDPDLPFRLDEWITSGNIRSMKRYINTIFGRQFRYQRGQLKCSISQIIVQTLFQKYRISCLILVRNKSDTYSDVSDVLQLKSEDLENLGEIQIRAYSAGPYLASFESDSVSFSNVISLNKDDELKSLSVSYWINKVGRSLMLTEIS